MDITDSGEELFLTQNSFSQDILQPNFIFGSLFDPAVMSLLQEIRARKN